LQVRESGQIPLLQSNLDLKQLIAGIGGWLLLAPSVLLLFVHKG